MIDLGRLFDTYNRQARLYPALIAIFPIVLLIVTWFPTLRTPLGAFASLAAAFGLVLWLSQIARDAGKRREPELYALWGGKPSVSLLRYRDQRTDPHTKERYRAFLEARVPKLVFATPETEAIDPARADQGYESATAWLLTQTRDTKRFALLFHENISYGFRRNLWGLKPLGLWISSSSAAASSIASGYLAVIHGSPPTTDTVLATALVWGLCVCWLTIVRSSWVRIPADAYGSQLLAACDTLQAAQDPH
jgi:hypothetical protein